MRTLRAVLWSLGAMACASSPPPKPIEPPSKPVEVVPRADEEDEPEDGVEISGLKGHLAQEDIDAGMRPHLSAIADCLDERESKYVQGAVTIRVDVARDGSVSGVRIAESDLGSAAIEACVVGVATQMSFRKPKGGATFFTFPLAVEATKSVDHWDVGRIQKELAKQWKQLHCEGKPPADASFTMYIGNRGKVLAAGAHSASAALDATWATCLYEALATWSFPDPRGRVAKVTFPIPTRP